MSIKSFHYVLDNLEDGSAGITFYSSEELADFASEYDLNKGGSSFSNNTGCISVYYEGDVVPHLGCHLLTPLGFLLKAAYDWNPRHDKGGWSEGWVVLKRMNFVEKLMDNLALRAEEIGEPHTPRYINIVSDHGEVVQYFTCKSAEDTLTHILEFYLKCSPS